MTDRTRVGSRSLRVAYLSGSPRIATWDDAAVFGPRARILGLMDALRADGAVDDFIVGDRLPPVGVRPASQRLLPLGRLRQLAIDVVPASSWSSCAAAG